MLNQAVDVVGDEYQTILHHFVNKKRGKYDWYVLCQENDVMLWSLPFEAPPGWLSGERVGLMTWWLRVLSPVEETFLSGVFSLLTSAEACEKGSRWLWKEKVVLVLV